MFAKIMIKYVFGILFGAVLLLGFQQKTDTGLQKLRSTAVTVTQNVQFQFRALSNNHTSISKNTVKKASDRKNIFGIEIDYFIDDCIPEDFFHFRYRTRIVPSRIFKDAAIAVRGVLNSPDIEGVENMYQGFSSHANYTKFSNRYYVYTLEHIQI